MGGVFFSHASADHELVDPFVDYIVRLGCGVPTSQTFYSSGEDTGVPSGYDLASHIRDRVADASIVVAIISPSFQTRPFCVAELGAAWARVGNLFPIAVPGMERTDLEGVLAGMAVRHLDEGSALDELHDRVGVAVGEATEAKSWGRYKAKWLANVQATSSDFRRCVLSRSRTTTALTRSLREQGMRFASLRACDEPSTSKCAFLQPRSRRTQSRRSCFRTMRFSVFRRWWLKPRPPLRILRAVT